MPESTETNAGRVSCGYPPQPSRATKSSRVASQLRELLGHVLETCRVWRNDVLAPYIAVEKSDYAIGRCSYERNDSLQVTVR